ncbi:NAD(P)/FAD-dependent oxidoreductase [Ruegeria sp. EL01]|jgi:putative flavoprotein involved in K+ transport|uniref:flavin-containing monooxygenase n=1 Tax=Ruegeria sp. EL01 TaxID=2107578 RepID=UPI000EA83756|nr:NAD(P)/FAD-dependent oxidoreductase [Ruegeria sp. EL01]
MRHISTVIIGAGQAGLAMSKCLSDRSVAHVVLERGEVAQSWMKDRWESLRLLTPNWQSRLPGYKYDGPDPDGYMSMPQITGYLRDYAHVIDAPVEEHTAVHSVTSHGNNYLVRANKGVWICDNVVVASGACARPKLPQLAGSVPETIMQLSLGTYKSPDQVAKGGALVVGGSASGVQIAAELSNAGHAVTLAVGEHIRAPRRYRGRDIQWWMDRSGVLDVRVKDVDDIDRARRVPSFQLMGDPGVDSIDLNTLQAMGIVITGRLAAIQDGMAQFSGSLANHCAMSDQKIDRLLRHFDDWAERLNVTDLPEAQQLPPTLLSNPPRLISNLRNGAIQTIVWATGYSPDYSWLKLPVFDQKGMLIHDQGVVAPGLYVMGLPFMRRRKSALIDGVGGDAQALSDHLIANRNRRAA